MFMLKSTHRAIRADDAALIASQRDTIEKADAARFEAQNIITRMEGEIADLRAELAHRQVIAVRNGRTGRFEKREA